MSAYDSPPPLLERVISWPVVLGVLATGNALNALRRVRLGLHLHAAVLGTTAAVEAAAAISTAPALRERFGRGAIATQLLGAAVLIARPAHNTRRAVVAVQGLTEAVLTAAMLQRELDRDSIAALHRPRGTDG